MIWFVKDGGDSTAAWDDGEDGNREGSRDGWEDGRDCAWEGKKGEDEWLMAREQSTEEKGAESFGAGERIMDKFFGRGGYGIGRLLA